MKHGITFGITLILLGGLLLGLAGSANAEEYRIGPEDVLEIKFWQDKTLDARVRVGQDSLISLDLIGEIKAGGRTTQELSDDIVYQISRLNNRISQAVVRVVAFNSQYVFVTGEVKQPGKKAFEEIPTLLSILKEAGWTTDRADLGRVTIIRGGRDAGKVEVVDVARAITEGTVGDLPRIYREDAVDVPVAPMGLPTGSLAEKADQRNAIYVIGAVGRPGPLEYEESVDLLEAIAMAGGFTEAADLGKVTIVSKDGLYAQTMRVDLEKYFDSGTPERYIMQKEDVVVIPSRKGTVLRTVIDYATPALGALTSALLLYETLRSNNDN